MTGRHSQQCHLEVAVVWMQWWWQVAVETEVGEPGDWSRWLSPPIWRRLHWGSWSTPSSAACTGCSWCRHCQSRLDLQHIHTQDSQFFTHELIKIECLAVYFLVLSKKNVKSSLNMTFVFFRCQEKYVVNESSVADPDPPRSERLLFGSGFKQKLLRSATHLHAGISLKPRTGNPVAGTPNF